LHVIAYVSVRSLIPSLDPFYFHFFPLPIHFFLFPIFGLRSSFHIVAPIYSFLWLYEAGLDFLHIQIPPYLWAIDLVLEENRLLERNPIQLF
jgi:hypothetical protein